MYYIHLQSFFFFFFFFFFFTYLHIQTVPLGYLIVNLVKFASCSCVHSFVHGCLKVVNGNIKFGMGMRRFGMEHFSQRGSTAWLLVVVRALVLVSEIVAAAIQVVSVGFHGRNTCPGLPVRVH